MLVKDVMETDIVSCDLEASLQVAVKRMLTNHVGSVIVTRDGDPFGIVTETDALHAGAVTERPFTDIPIRKVASHPLVTATKGETVRTVIERMHENEIKKLPVIDDLDIIGIVTQTDIRQHYSDFIHEAHSLDKNHGTWSPESDRTSFDE